MSWQCVCALLNRACYLEPFEIVQLENFQKNDLACHVVWSSRPSPSKELYLSHLKVVVRSTPIEFNS